MNYMCPEAFEDTGKGDVDPTTGRQTPVIKQGRASDIWSLGCILYQMAHGEALSPYDRMGQAHGEALSPCDRIGLAQSVALSPCDRMGAGSPSLEVRMYAGRVSCIMTAERALFSAFVSSCCCCCCCPCGHLV